MFVYHAAAWPGSKHFQHLVCPQQLATLPVVRNQAVKAVPLRALRKKKSSSFLLLSNWTAVGIVGGPLKSPVKFLFHCRTMNAHLEKGCHCWDALDEELQRPGLVADEEAPCSTFVLCFSVLTYILIFFKKK